MAAANESQGLKIAVAVFVTFTVLLAVATYFSYTSYSQAEAKLTATEGKLSTANKASSDALTQIEGLLADIGLKSQDTDAIKVENKANLKKVDDEVTALTTQVNEMVTKAQAAGATGPELEDAKAKVQQIAASYREDPDKSYNSALSRISSLLKNLALLTTQVSLNYVDVKRNLEGADGVNAQKLKVEADALTKSKEDLAAEGEKHVSERQTILARVDQYQTDNAKMQTEIANLTAKLRQVEEEGGKKLALAQSNVRDIRSRMELKETVLDRPDGVITFVDYTRGEVHTNVTRSKGARPQMVFTIFDAGSPGLPTDKPKGTVELLQVGEKESIARIVQTTSTIEPIRTGDFVYSAAWSPNEPMRFALIGKMDLNRDGKDDRDDLKRMIEAAGGIVDYDLPPPEVGKETGKLTGRDAWYVVDDPKARPPYREYGKNTGVTENETAEHLKKQTEAVREARLNGVRPMELGRLLTYLGYDFAAVVRGRAEAVDKEGMKRLMNSNKRRAETAPAAPATAPK